MTDINYSFVRTKATTKLVCSHPQKYNISVPVQHWQLRDMLKVGDNGLVYCTGNKVCKLDINHNSKKYTYDSQDTNSHNMSVIMDDLPFFPSTIDVSPSTIAVAGQRGHFAFKTIHRTVVSKLGDSINNSVRIMDHTLIFSSNDRTLKFYDLHLNKTSLVLEHPWPVNNCGLNNDNTVLVTVGDTNEVNIYNRNGSTYSFNTTIKTLKDAAFKVAWNNDHLFAISTQDGYVCIYDIRKVNKQLYSYNSSNNSFNNDINSGIPLLLRSAQPRSIKGAIRNVIFTKHRSLDLMLFTEHSTFFSVIDTRNYTEKQIITIDYPEHTTNSKQISGATFHKDKIYISTDDTLYEYKIKTKNRRLFME